MKKNIITKEQQQIINDHSEMSSHFIIDKDGKTVYVRTKDGFVKITTAYDGKEKNEK